jgi:hypothetical protein
LNGHSGAADKPEEQTIRASRLLGPRRWDQYLKFTTMGRQIYFDEGNGASSAN